MSRYEAIQSRSHDAGELVLGYSDAIEMLHLFEKRSTRILGWEGWILYPSGEMGHSEAHQGTVDLSEISVGAALALVKSTIQQANVEWQKNPEVEGGQLLFCITPET